MFLVNVAIERTAQAVVPVLDPDLVIRALRAEMTRDNGLEHISARAGPNGVQVGIFCRATNRETAEANARRICRTMLESQPQFIGWQLAGSDS